MSSWHRAPVRWPLWMLGGLIWMATGVALLLILVAAHPEIPRTPVFARPASSCCVPATRPVRA